LVASEFDAALREINSKVNGGIGFNEVYRPSEHQADLYNASLKTQAAWNANGLNLTGKLKTGFHAGRPHLDDVIPLGLGALAGWLAKESFGPIGAGVSALYAPGKRLYNATVDQNKKEREIEAKYFKTVQDCQAKTRG
jgi:hypothetical protein